MSELRLHEQVGFDYIEAVGELLKKMTYRQIADHLGYKSVGSVSSILEGKTPSHVHGEAIWALYMETFKKKPPLQRKANSLP